MERRLAASIARGDASQHLRVRVAAIGDLHLRGREDLSAIPGLSGLAEKADLLPVADRILFGSDFPNLPYPWARERVWLEALGLPEPALEGILRGNALRLAGRAVSGPSAAVPAVS